MSELEHVLAPVEPGHHICLIYDDPADQMAAVVPFLKEGLARRAQCVYVADDRTVEEVATALTAAGIDVARERERGALLLWTREDYRQPGAVEPAGMLELLRQRVDRALAAGFTAVRIAAEMTWALASGVTPEQLIEYEASANTAFFPTTRAAAICQYNRRRFPPDLLRQAVRAHPEIVLGDEVCPNPCYEPPERLLRGEAPGVDWMITQIELAREAARADEKARLWEQTERRRRAAERLAEVGRLVSQSLDPEVVAQRIVESVCDLFGAVAATLYRVEPRSEDRIAIAVSGDVGPAWGPGFVVPRGSGVSGVAVSERRPVTTPDILTDPRIQNTPEERARAEQAGYRAVLAVPLPIKDRVIGALAVGKRAGQVFDDEEIRLAQAFADQAAIALENARLFEEQARLLRETRRQHAEALALELVARQITSSLEREEVLQRIVDRARALCGADIAFLAPYDQGTGTATIVAAAGARPHDILPITITPGQGIGGRVLETGEPLTTEDDPADPRISGYDVEAAAEDGPVAQAVVPLRLRDTITGLLGVVNRTPRRFTTRDLAILTKLADQAAIALENSRLYAERTRAEADLQARARQQAAIATLGQRALAGPDLAIVMDDAVGLVAETLGVEYCQVLELLSGGEALLLRAGVGWKEGYVGHATVRTGANSQAGYTLLSDEPVIVADLRTETRFNGPPLLRDHRVVSGVSVVIRGQQRPFGVLGAQTTRRRPFTQDDVSFLQSVANVLATAIQRRQAEQAIEESRQRLQALFDTVRQHAERLKVLHAIDQAILSAQSPEAIALAALQHIRHLVPCQRADIALVDLETDEVTVLAADASGEAKVQAGTSLPLEIFEDTTETLDGLRGKVRVVDDISTFPQPSPAVQTWQAEGMRAFIHVPLVAGGQPIGTFNLLADHPAAFAFEHVEIAREVGASLAVAIRDSRLFAQVVAARERLQALSRRLVEVQEMERRHIARELHDEIGQVLTGLKLTLETNAPGPSASPDEPRKLVNDLITRVRELSLDLRPAMLDDFGLLPALFGVFERYSAQTGVRVEFDHAGLAARFQPETETAAYRIVQEALTNVARHAGVREVTVRVWVGGDALNVQVEDRGCGFDPRATRPSSGLTGMRERAELLGGSVTVDSAPGAGTRVTAELPLGAPVERRPASG